MNLPIDNTLNHPIDEPVVGNRGAFWLAVLLIGVAFFCTEHKLLTSVSEDYGTSAEVLAAAAEGGHLKNQVGFSLLALLGLVLLVRRGGRRFSGLDTLGVLILASLALCMASALWSVSPWFTIKRFGIVVFCFLGALGVAKHLTMRDLCRLTLTIATLYAVIGAVAEVALGTFTPWAAGYRFAGTIHPNGQSVICASMCLTGIALLGSSKRKPLLIALIVIGAVLLLLTKSRTTCAALLAGLLTYYLLRAPLRTKIYSGVAAGWAACGLLLAVNLLHAQDQLFTAVTLGRSEHVGTLTGRTELWQELLRYIQRRPLLGHGYAAFWTPEQVEEISSTLFWGITSAHSVYLTLLLDLGLIGAVLFLTTLLVGMWRAARTERVTGDAGSGFILSLFVFGAISGVAEAGFVDPSFLTWVAGCGLVQLAFFREWSNPQHATV